MSISVINLLCKITIILLVFSFLSGCVGNDTDGDNVNNEAEIEGIQITIYTIDGTMETKMVYSDPNKADTDNDGLNDYEEMIASTDPSSSDTDNDGLSDSEEHAGESSPIHFDSWIITVKGEEKRVFAEYSDHGVLSTEYDGDKDGLVDAEEYIKGSDPTDADTDDDGTEDYFDPEPGWNLKLHVTLNTFELKNSKDIDGGADLYFVFQVGNVTRTTDVWDVSLNQQIDLNKEYIIDFADISAYDSETISVQVFAFDEDSNSILGDSLIQIVSSSDEYATQYDIFNTEITEITTDGNEGDLSFSLQIQRT